MAQIIKSTLRQIKWLAKKSHKPEIIYYPFIQERVIMNDEPFSLEKGRHSWEQQLKILADTHGVEVHTPDKAQFKNVIGVLFFDNMFYHNLPALKKLHKKDLLKKTIYIDFEPPTGHAKKHEQESIKILSGLFKAVVTYDDDLAGKGNFIKGNVANFYAKPSKRQGFSKKKFAVMVTNNTTASMIVHSLNYWNNTEYYDNKKIKYHKKAVYHKRLEIVDFFHKNHSDSLDLFGVGFPEKYNTFNKGFLERSKKISTMSGYKFTIALDSYTNQNGYISEKIFDAFFAKTLPIYLGAYNVSEYIPNDCFVDLREFSSYEDLYQYLKNMGKKEYEDRIDAIEDFLKSDKFHALFSSEAIAKTLFNVATSKPITHYDHDHAQKILDELALERSRLLGENIITPRIDKEIVDGKWSFIVSVKPGKNDGKSLDGKIFAVADGKKIRVKTYNDTHPELEGNTCVVIPYEEVYNSRQLQYFVGLGKGRSVKLIFSTLVQKMINGTNYDDDVAFYVIKNMIGVRHVSSSGKQ